MSKPTNCKFSGRVGLCGKCLINSKTNQLVCGLKTSDDVYDLGKRKIENALRCIEDDIYDFDVISKLDLFMARNDFYIYQRHNAFKYKLYYVDYFRSDKYCICITYDCYDEPEFIDQNTELVVIENVEVVRIPGII